MQCIIVRNKATKKVGSGDLKEYAQKVSMKSTFPVAEVQIIFFKEGGNATDETWICESQREKFRCQKCYGESFIHLQ